MFYLYANCFSHIDIRVCIIVRKIYFKKLKTTNLPLLIRSAYMQVP